MSRHLTLVEPTSDLPADTATDADDYSYEARMRQLSRLLPKEERARAVVVNEVRGALVSVDLRTGNRRVLR